MQARIDPRLIQVGIEIDGKITTYDQNFYIKAEGTRYANANQNECEVKIANLSKSMHDFILSETSAFNLNKTPKRLTVDAGRVSYGLTRIFSGDIISSSTTQPPDVTITLKALTGNYAKGNVISRSKSSITQLRDIAKQVAEDLDVSLDFQAQDKQIGNYNFSGGALKQVNKLNDTGQVDAYIDNGVLVVKDIRLPLSNRVTILNVNTGMIGIPEITEQGIKVKFLLDGQTTLGGAVKIESIVYPAANGTYAVYKLSFNIASREEPFYWIAEGTRL